MQAICQLLSLLHQLDAVSSESNIFIHYSYTTQDFDLKQPSHGGILPLFSFFFNVSRPINSYRLA
jgi:hypothetical protein